MQSNAAESLLQEIVIPCPTWKEIKPWIYRLAGIALALYLAYLVREIWLPLMLALLVALVLDPVVDRMERRGYSRTLGAAIIFGGFIIAVGGFLFVSVPTIVEQGQSIQERFAKVVPDQSPAGIDAALKKQGAPPMVRSVVKAIVINAESSVSRSSSVFLDKLVAYASNLIWLVIVPVVAFYALRDFHLILAKALLLVKKEKRPLVQTAVAEVTAIFAKYMRGLLIVSTLNGIATWLVLALLGVPSSLALGTLAGILYMVPYIGAVITVVVISSVALVSGGANYMVLVLGCNLILHQVIFDQIITPRILGRQVGLHPILAIIALLSGNALLGLIGMVLAVPVAACIQIGVLALVPKLAQDIPLPEVETAKIEEQTKEHQIRVDATDELHQSVTDVVETIEAELPKQQARKARILRRRKSRADGNGP